MTGPECPTCGEIDPSTLMGHEVPGVYDGILYWVHMPCNTAWPRFADGKLGRIADDYVATHNMAVQRERER